MPKVRQPDFDETGFTAFWDGYPKCKRKQGNRVAAQAAFIRAVRKTSAATIMGGLKSYPWNPDPDFLPMPSTWLNQCRWEVDLNDAPAAPDPSDDYGARAWAASLPDAKLDRIPGVYNPVPCLNGYAAAETAVEVCALAGLPPHWRGSLAPLAEWLRADIDPDTIAAAIKRVRKPASLESIAYFDKAVREQKERARS